MIRHAHRRCDQWRSSSILPRITAKIYNPASLIDPRGISDRGTEIGFQHRTDSVQYEAQFALSMVSFRVRGFRRHPDQSIREFRSFLRADLDHRLLFERILPVIFYSDLHARRVRHDNAIGYNSQVPFPVVRQSDEKSCVVRSAINQAVLILCSLLRHLNGDFRRVFVRNRVGGAPLLRISFRFLIGDAPRLHFRRDFPGSTARTCAAALSINCSIFQISRDCRAAVFCRQFRCCDALPQHKNPHAGRCQCQNPCLFPDSFLNSAAQSLRQVLMHQKDQSSGDRSQSRDQTKSRHDSAGLSPNSPC